jgi:uncharacterized protein (DUF2147 family)
MISAIDLSSIASGVDGFVINGGAPGDRSGISVSSAGDVDGDGLDDLIIGADRADPSGKLGAGRSYLVFGKETGNVVELSNVSGGIGGFLINGGAPGDYSGISVSGAGDVDGDGLDDLIIGADRADPSGKLGAGRSYVVFGKKTGNVVELSNVSGGIGGFLINGGAPGDYSGISVSSAGDVNGDGLDDLIIGAARANPSGRLGAGRSYVVFGKKTGNVVELSNVSGGIGGFLINGGAPGDRSGISVSSAGDVNGDGLDDLIIGADGADTSGKLEAGRSYVVFGKKTGNVVELSNVSGGIGGFLINGEEAVSYSGISVSSAGDVNGDGLDDLIIGAYGADSDNRSEAGRSYVVFGKKTGNVVELSQVSAGTGGFAINGEVSGDYSGISVSAAGDVNGDGLDDLIVGADGVDPSGKLEAGRSYVVFGKKTGNVVELSQVSAGTGGFAINGEVSGDYSGISVSAAGDVNGDGLADLIVGSPNASPGNRNGSGRSYVLFSGRKFTNSVIQFGNTGNDTLTGTANSQSLVGAQGNDQLNDGNFTDLVLYGGAGSDRINIRNSSFRRIDGGGLSTDTLALAGTGLTLNLTTLPNTRISGIELIDLTGTGNNNLMLDLPDLLSLSDTTNQITVLGNSGDTVTSTGQGWVSSGTQTFGSNIYARYTIANAVLLVDTDITRSIS